MIPAAREVFLVTTVLAFAYRKKRDMNRRLFYALPYQLFKQRNTKCIDRSRLVIMARLFLSQRRRLGHCSDKNLSLYCDLIFASIPGTVVTRAARAAGEPHYPANSGNGAQVPPEGPRQGWLRQKI